MTTDPWGGTSLPHWFTRGVEAIFDALPGLHRIEIHPRPALVFGETVLEGEVRFVGEDFVGIDEDLLDRVPQVRMIERRIEHVLAGLPISIAEDQGMSLINGDVTFEAARDGIVFHHHDATTDVSYGIATAAGGVERETLALISYSGPETVAATLDHEAMMMSVDPIDIGLDERPRTLSVSFDEDDAVIYDLVPGELHRCRPK